MPLVKFTHENKEIEVPAGAVLRTEAIKAGINLNCGLNGYGENLNKVFNCKGFGFCGTCRVLITQGIENTNKLTKREWTRFKTPVALIPDPTPCLAYVGNEEDDASGVHDPSIRRHRSRELAEYKLVR